jgi:uncharacterized protein (TIGR02265 family)
METPETRLIFSPTVQGLFHIALRGRLSGSARESLREVGLDLDGDLTPAYPITTWLQCLEIARRDVWPDLPPDESWRLLGQAVLEGSMATMVGRVMAAAARALGPRMSLGQFDRGFRASNNFQRSRLTERAPTAYEMWISDIVGRPTYYVGLLEAALKMMGARAPRVSVLRREEPACVFFLEWEA